jgi:hypothetical protein
MRGCLAIVLAALVWPASAQTVQKCVDAKGHVTLTSGSCPAGQREEASYEATPERHDPAKARRLAELEQWRRAQDARRNQGAPVPRAPQTGTSSTRHSRCEAAKQYRDRELAALGLKRTHADLRRLGDHVYRQCQ